jgi:hypothetical protein
MLNFWSTVMTDFSRANLCHCVPRTKCTQWTWSDTEVIESTHLFRSCPKLLKRFKIEVYKKILGTFHFGVFQSNITRTLQKTKGKGVPLHAMEEHEGERRYSSYSYLTSATRWGWVVSVTPRPRFAPGERTPGTGTHWIGGWVGLRAGLDVGLEEKSSAPVGDRTSIARSSSP